MELKEKEAVLSEQLKHLLNDKTKLEKELQKLREEVCKVIMGESLWSQSTLSNAIETKEQELVQIKKKQKELEFKISEVSSYLSAKKKTCSDFEDWGEKFDLQDTAMKKSMLINMIDRITVYDDKITVKYRFKCDYLPGGSKYDKSNDLGFESVLEGGVLCPARVQSTYQPNRAR